MVKSTCDIILFKRSIIFQELAVATYIKKEICFALLTDNFTIYTSIINKHISSFQLIYKYYTK